KIREALEGTGNPAFLRNRLVDFGCRGSTSPESAALGGLAHLVNFDATDNIPAMSILEKYYGKEPFPCTICATEHSTITSWTKEGEADAYSNLLDQYGREVFACVSDSYNIYNACEN